MASLYLSRRIKNFIMLGIIIVAFIIAFNKSDIINAFLKPSDVMGHAPKKAQEMFQHSKYDTKVELNYITPEIKDLKNEIDDCIIENDLNTIYSKISSNNLTKLIEIPRDKYKSIIISLRDHEELSSDELVQSAESASAEFLNQRIKDEEKVKEKILNDLSQVRSVYETESLQENLQRQSNILDSLRQTLAERKQHMNNVLAKIEVSHFVSRTDVTESALKTFLITFAVSLLFISIGLFVIYFILILFTKLFSVLGIKTTHGQPSRYSGYSGYGGYGRYGSSSYGHGYDYGNRKKIKRKYIRKPKSEVEEHLEKDESEDKDTK
ncbi:MAG: hypothetical protein JW794_03540 [Candidatus Cloacimonetes bacterium]|nr:hypothetical protein [Candidatus Cloacimonadota bacterium]